MTHKKQHVFSSDFDAESELKAIKGSRSIQPKKRYRRSKLMPYRVELVELKRAGASDYDLTFWLKESKKMEVSRTTVMRYLKSLPELQEGNE